MIRIKLLCIFILLATCAFTQESINTNIGQLTLTYFPLERIKLFGNTDLYLPTHKDFLKPFDSSQRFAPDEPSSFSSLEYTIQSGPISNNFMWDYSGGIYRNHTKGDFLLDRDTVHFGRGNSQAGLSLTLKLYNRTSQKIEYGLFLQNGIGLNFSRLESGGNIVRPDNWKIVGYGVTYNIAAFIGSPYFFKRWKANVLAIYNLSYSRYFDFEVMDTGENETIKYENIHFATRSKRPNFTITLSYDLYKNK